MKILSAEQIRLWDQYTIRHEPIASIDLMERAATKCVEWLERNFFSGSIRLPDSVSGEYSVFCGKGNNGGDGLAIARMLVQKKYSVTVYILESGHKGTEDFQTNLALLHQYPQADIRFIQAEDNFHELQKNEIIIDAMFGTGLNRG
ncbi:MAG: NAD(P)H-hydrate epimerase, partial [Chitinophagaceae bacterium]